MKRTVKTAISFCLAGIVLLSGARSQALEIKPCAVAPEIDGVLNDPAWRNAAKVEQFFVIGKGLPTNKHAAWITYDDAWLYVAFDVAQGELERLAPYYVKGHDDFVQRDDCVKLSFDPGGNADPWYHFKLNRANIRQDRRIQASKAQDIEAWNIPWKSAVQNTGTNWTVELAVPFGLLPPFKRLDRSRLNLVITTLVPKRDAQDVVIEAPFRTDFSLSPVADSWFEPDKFIRVTGLGKLAVQTPFLPYAGNVQVTPYFEKENAYHYGIAMELGNLGAEPGRIKFIVEDKPSGAPATKIEESLDLPAGRALQPHLIAVPAASMQGRSVVLRLVDGASGAEWQRITLAGEAVRALDVFSGYLDRNYYTVEKEAVAIFTFNLPDSAMARMTLAAQDAAGKTLAEIKGVKSQTRLAVPLSNLPQGSNPVTFLLQDENKRRLSSLAMEIIKRAPLPGCEWKVDKINRVLLDNGKPFFALGLCSQRLGTNDVETLRKLKASGFNFVHLWVSYNATNLMPYARMFEKEGMNFMTVPDDAAAKAKGTYTFKNPKYAWFKPQTVTQMKGYACHKFFAVRETRNAVFQEYLDWLMPDILAIVSAAKTSPALLGHFIFDEPFVDIFDQGLIGRKLYDRINEIDGYHPVMVNYSSEIPDVEQARNWMDILATDPYWVPGNPGMGVRSTASFVSMITARTVAAGEPRRQVCWIVPMCDRWSALIKRGATRDEQFCQSYLAAIHGAKGLMYFILESVQGNPIGWEAVAAVARQFADVLGAACTAPDVPQTISYARGGAKAQSEPVIHDPAKGIFADVQAAVKRDPQGGLILMAANSRPYPVACRIEVQGLKSAKIGRHFDTATYPVKDGAFSDQFEAYGVRAYRLEALPEPVNIRLTATPPEKIPPPETTAAWRLNKKNKMPNPCFEDCTRPNWPDYYTGNSGGWEQRIFIDEKETRVSGRSIRIDRGYLQAYCVPPDTLQDASGQYVFSLWMKAEQPERRIEIKDLGGLAFYEHVIAGPEWKRYEFPVELKPGRQLVVTIIGTKGSLWVDGMQFEKGAKATEFEK